MRGLAVTVALLLAACATVPQRARVTSYDSGEYAPYSKPGTASVRGEGFMIDGWGRRQTCAGRDVRLVPGTAYGEEEFQVRMWGQPVIPADPRALAAERRVTADADGRFEFTGVPAGRWFVLAEVRWSSLGPFGLTAGGGHVGAEIDLGDGETKDVVLTR